MIFGFLMFDILLWAVFPLVLLLLLWGDKKAWAGTLTIAALIALAFMDWSKFSTNITDPVWLGNLLKHVAIYAGIGLGFTFLKWKVLASKTARGFSQFLDKFDMSIDITNVEKSMAKSKAQGGVDAFDAEYETALAEAKAQATTNLRERAAAKWNESYSNQYRAVLRVKDDNGVWKTSYQKFVLSQYITSWIVYWPFYVILLVVDDLIRHIADWFVEVFGKGYQKLADASFADIK